MGKTLKDGLDIPVDMGAFVIKTRGRTIVPFAGEHVWIEPYLDSRTELELAKAHENMKATDEQGAEANFALIASILAKVITRWDLTDKHGEALPQPDNADAFYALPARAILFLMQEAMGVEPEGEGSGGSAA